MRNPCRDCGHLHKDKNGEECRQCDARLEYVRSLADPDHAMPCAGSGKSGGLQMTEEKRDVVTKACRICGKDLPADSDHFYKNKLTKDKLESMCKTCRRGQQKTADKNRQAKKKAAKGAGADPARPTGGSTGAASKAGQVPEADNPYSPGWQRWPGKVEKVGAGGGRPPSLSLDFEAYPELFEQLAKAAGESFRTPELQAMFFIKICVGEPGDDS